MLHSIRIRNLPFSVKDVKRLVKTCRICAEHKPRFYKPIKNKLFLDFKGSLPSKTSNNYILTIIDEYSRFLFTIPCPDIKASSVIQNLCSLFVIFGLPAYIYSDRETAFISERINQVLRKQEVAVSRTTLYNSQGNGQCERYNCIIWMTIQLAAANHRPYTP